MREELINCRSSPLVCVLPLLRVAVIVLELLAGLRGLPETMPQLQSSNCHRAACQGGNRTLEAILPI